MSNNGSLSKLKIIAYADAEYNNPIADGEFVTLSNPDTYALTYKVQQNEEQAAGTTANANRFDKILPEELELEFMFDRTGALGLVDESGDGVVDDINKFKRITLDFNSETHEPNFLKIYWGSLMFKGRIQEMGITFKLFKPDGAPLRAVIKAKFKGAVDDELRVHRENASSPDLTHIRIVKESDKLPLMTKSIYGDSKYYLEVARTNGIINFRKLQTGQKIFFPPIEKLKN